ncbi:hypothetical protein A3D77_07300 [Candidatus Gottesmanbacteria bacterium RIFCSPHIGHO2_02_FULL_39_11]|uniref:Glycosyltransferase 2-like domain-containing protein n=1 Tax=Candidatus Gottesmanbacteria bacterium RIFCSPHIGHO2_02_FULL_39_11 TaxID=1798382 RepID=A0A1F5ZKI3_9BACT|nr:MAG: hypothetical protein A3D77_07300 [Candidatus Gottesmanbacteria bacterium RIFCSPHIGHO2_02_FULL_39_11]
MKLLIGIPAYNEAGIITKVLCSLPKTIPGITKLDTLVVDDGSTDETANLAEKEKVYVIKHLTNRGLGGALKTILYYAKTNQYDFLVTFDADGQHDARDIKRLISCMNNARSDVVVGSRWKNKTRAPLSRKLINKAANITTGILYGILTSDSQSGLRLFNRKAIEKIELKFDRMEVSSEIFGEIAKRRLKLSEVPIRGIYTNYSLSKGQKLSNSFDIIFRLILRFLQ